MQTNDYKYLIYRTKRKNLRLTLRSDGTLALYCPTRYPKEKAEEFIRLNARRLLEYGSERDSELLKHLFGNTEVPSLPYFGQRHPVIFDDTVTFDFDGESFHCNKKFDLDKCRSHYKEFLRTEAKRYIPPIVSNVASINNLHFNEVHIKSMSSRWGSCSSKKNLNFTLALIACDRNYIRYVISHELAHTVYMDHSNNFYTLVKKICPRSDDMRNRLKPRYSILLKAICNK